MTKIDKVLYAGRTHTASGRDVAARSDDGRLDIALSPPVPAGDAALMAATQRPIRDAALAEPSKAPAWKRLPSWFVYGTADKNIPPAALAFMASRAGAKKTIVVPGASHVLMISHPREVAEMIEAAAGG